MLYRSGYYIPMMTLTQKANAAANLTDAELECRALELMADRSYEAVRRGEKTLEAHKAAWWPDRR